MPHTPTDATCAATGYKKSIRHARDAIAHVHNGMVHAVIS